DPGEVADAQLVRLAECRRQHQPGRIRQRACLARCDIRLFASKPVLAQSLGHLQVQAEKVAAIVSHTNILTFVPTCRSQGCPREIPWVDGTSVLAAPPLRKGTVRPQRTRERRVRTPLRSQ